MGKDIIKGNGLMEQISKSNKRPATTATLKEFEEMISGTLQQPKDPKTGRFIKGKKVRVGGIANEWNNQREYVVMAGQSFAEELNEAIEDGLK